MVNKNIIPPATQHDRPLNQGRLWFPGFPLLVGVIAVSFSSIFIALCQAPAGAIGMYRLAFSVVFLLPFALRDWKSVRSITRGESLRMILAGVLLGLHFLFWIASLKHTSIASSMIITALQPAFAGLGAAGFFGERFSKGQLASMLLALVGIAVIGIGDADGSRSSLYGDLLSLLGTVAISGYLLAGQRVRQVTSSSTYNTIVFTIASLFLFVVNTINRTPMTGYRKMDWAWVLLLAIVPTLFGHALFNWLLRYVSAATLSMVVLGEPIGAIVLAWLFLHSRVTLAHALGGAMTLCAVWVFMHVTRPRRKITQG